MWVPEMNVRQGTYQSNKQKLASKNHLEKIHQEFVPITTRHRCQYESRMLTNMLKDFYVVKPCAVNHKKLCQGVQREVKAVETCLHQAR